ncbi:MAG TPA: RdgB/HAM1 family non-canonical purine NTP pyrophosphatase [bacterium]|nr:RdgB/HAM1 family non-canonical purine NTP pyrophosphatase [bacterium]HPS30279.1 RdgB/HAM1 family non-canonical purine NTP pyrophosphatase [bacterium]
MKIIFASGNKGKLKEAREIFAGHEIISIKDLCSDFNPEEKGGSFLQNAVIKTEEAMKLVKDIAVLSDDSGLVVKALNGAPGVYSSRYGGEEGNNELNRKKLLAELNGIEERDAYFSCTAVLLFPDMSAIVENGKCLGKIGYYEVGNGGFGYDPLFIPDGFEKTMAELEPYEKNLISHRGKAFRNIMERLNVNKS